MSFKRITSILIAAIISTSLLFGCEKTPPQSTQSSEPAKATLPEAKLIMYMVGDKGLDNDFILEEMNKKLKQDINATVEMKIMTVADVNTKYPLIFASGEEFDIVFSAAWAFYKQQAAKDGFLELKDDMLKKYAPKTAAELTPDKWKPVLVDGKKYLIPRTDYKYDPQVIVVRGDLRAKYNLPEIKTMADYEKYLDTIAQNEKTILPFGDNNAQNCWLMPAIQLNTPMDIRVIPSASSDLFYYNVNDKVGDQITIRESTPEYLAWIKKMVDWRKKGYWSNSALTAKGNADQEFIAGKSASTIIKLEAAVGLYNNQLNKNHPEWKMEVYDATFGKKVDFSIPIAGMALSANTKNAERSLMAIEIFRNDRALYDIMQYGIKDKNYVLTADGKTAPGPNATGYGNISYYGLRTMAFNRLPSVTYPTYESILKTCEARANTNPLSQFSLNIDNVKNEFAACKALYDQYRPILNMGFNDDPEKTLQEYMSKMKAAGYDKIYDECKKQAKQFVIDYSK